MKANIKDAQINILIEINNKIHMVSMDKKKFEAIEAMIKVSTDTVVQTNKTQEDLLNFLDYPKSR